MITSLTVITDPENDINTISNSFFFNWEILLPVHEDCQKIAFFAIQQARMFANQGITVDKTVDKTLDETD